LRRLIILYTKFPTPGQVKTRLIPTLGAEGAAKAHRLMVDHALSHLEKLAGTTREIHFAGARLSQMQDWLGSQSFVEQRGLDLGARLVRSFADSFNQGQEAVLIIGSDCPELSAQHLEEAFEALATKPLVLGPALDGGYYLIGLNRPVPQLFSEIPWSSPWVLKATLDIASHLGLSYHLLPPLGDVDEPVDLELFYRIFGRL